MNKMNSEPLTLINMPDQYSEYLVEDDPVLIRMPGAFDLQGVQLGTLPEILPDLTFDVLQQFHSLSKVSHKLRRIYVDIDMDFPVQFTWNGPPAMNVRATCVFADEAQAEKRVERCVQHYHQSTNTDPKISRNVLHSSRDVTAGGVHYQGNPDAPDSWLSVVVELTKPNDGPTQHAYRFTCKNSCTSGINRRAILIVFTLEDQNGIIYGRDIVGARVCACPRRDMSKDEESEGVPRSTKRRAPAASPPRTKVKKEDIGDAILDLATLNPRSALVGLEVMINMEVLANEARPDPRGNDTIARLRQIQEYLKAKHPTL